MFRSSVHDPSLQCTNYHLHPFRPYTMSIIVFIGKSGATQVMDRVTYRVLPFRDLYVTYLLTLNSLNPRTFLHLVRLSSLPYFQLVPLHFPQGL